MLRKVEQTKQHKKILQIDLKPSLHFYSNDSLFGLEKLEK